MRFHILAHGPWAACISRLMGTNTTEVTTMIDSLLSLTKGRAFWMAIAFVIAVLMHAGIVLLTGVQEPMGLLGALLIPVFFVVSLAYTLVKRILRR